jgi:hypothetical protein
MSLLSVQCPLSGAHRLHRGALADGERDGWQACTYGGELNADGRTGVSAEREPLHFSSSPGRQRGRSSPSPDSAYESPHLTALNEIRRDLHDVVGNALVCMAMELEQLARTGHADHSKVQVMIAELRDETADLINHVRRLAHGHTTHRVEAHGDTTHRVEDVGMALGTMISRINHKVGPRLTFTLSYDPAVRLVPADIRSAAFWITREAIINVLKHSQARNCAVSLTVSGAFLRIQVEDDGVMPAQRQGGGRGLTNMAERAAEHGGWCRASRLQPRGFAVLASLPAFPRGIDSNEREFLNVELAWPEVSAEAGQRGRGP